MRWMDGRWEKADGLMYVGWRDGHMDGGMAGWIDRWMDLWLVIDEWIDG
jgi:hypothetical protein